MRAIKTYVLYSSREKYKQSRLTSTEVNAYFDRYERSHRPLRAFIPTEVRQRCCDISIIYFRSAVFQCMSL